MIGEQMWPNGFQVAKLRVGPALHADRAAALDPPRPATVSATCRRMSFGRCVGGAHDELHGHCKWPCRRGLGVPFSLTAMFSPPDGKDEAADPGSNSIAGHRRLIGPASRRCRTDASWRQG